MIRVGLMQLFGIAAMLGNPLGVVLLGAAILGALAAAVVVVAGPLAVREWIRARRP